MEFSFDILAMQFMFQTFESTHSLRAQSIWLFESELFLPLFDFCGG